MATYTTNYNLYKPDATDSLSDFREGFNNNMDEIDAHLGGGGSKHTIVDENGQAMPNRTYLEFTGGVQVTDDAGNNKTVVNIQGGGGGSSSLAGLTDVDLTAPTDGQVLSYDGNNSKWVNGAAVFFSEYASEVYSNTEREVGCWIDGKPLYQKTISFLNQALVLGDNFLNLGISDIESVVHCKAYITNSAHTTIRPINSWGQNAGAQILYVITPSSGTFDIVTASAWTSPNIYITLLYTKTTDAPGSGKLVPSAMPAVHYSTSEQIIGTWIDGKPLYEKTIEYNCSNVSTVQTAYAIPSTHVVKTVCDAYFENSTGGLSQQFRYTWYKDHFWSYIVNNSGHVISVHRETTDGNWQSGVKFVAVIRYTKTTD